MKIGIVEDELLVAESIVEILEELGYEPGKPAASYTRAIKMLEEFKPDLVLVDIQLYGSKDGIDLATTIREQADYLPLIFLTANSDRTTIERAKVVKPDAYLVKPFTKRELFAAIEIAFSNIAAMHGESSVQKYPATLFVKQDQSFLKLRTAEILFAEADHVYVTFYMADGRKILTRATMKEYAAQLNPAFFFQSHRSYLVNLQQIEKVEEAELHIGTHRIPLSRGNKPDLLKLLKAL